MPAVFFAPGRRAAQPDAERSRVISIYQPHPPGSEDISTGAVPLGKTLTC
jgi:hypothetical protein